MIPDVGDWVIDARRERAEPETIDEDNADTGFWPGPADGAGSPTPPAAFGTDR